MSLRIRRRRHEWMTGWPTVLSADELANSCDHSGIIVRVDHDGHALTRRRSRREVCVEPLVAAAVTEAERAASVVEEDTESVAIALDGEHASSHDRRNYRR